MKVGSFFSLVSSAAVNLNHLHGVKLPAPYVCTTYMCFSLDSCRRSCKCYHTFTCSCIEYPSFQITVGRVLLLSCLPSYWRELTYSFGFGDSLVNVWVRCGILAISTLTLLCFLTLRPIRERNYEAFLWIHFVFTLWAGLSLQDWY